MQQPFLAEIVLYAFAPPPPDWLPCDGRLLPINQNQALFSLLGTTFGGNGETNFALPNYTRIAPEGTHYCIAVVSTPDNFPSRN